MRNGIAVVCAALAATSAARARPEMKAPTAADERAVEKVPLDFKDAWNKHDAKALANGFAEDGDLINPMGTAAKGREQIRKLFDREHGGRLKQSKMALQCEPARFLAVNVAEVDCDYTLEGITAPQAPAVLRGHITLVVVREGGKWSIASQRAMVPMELGPGAKSAEPQARPR